MYRYVGDIKLTLEIQAITTINIKEEISTDQELNNTLVRIC